MKTYLIAIYDRKTKMYGPMMNPRSIVRVQQEFTDLCKNPETQYSKHPEDYEVHLLGEFNDSPEHDPHVGNILLQQYQVIATGN